MKSWVGVAPPLKKLRGQLPLLPPGSCVLDSSWKLVVQVGVDFFVFYWGCTALKGRPKWFRGAQWPKGWAPPPPVCTHSALTPTHPHTHTSAHAHTDKIMSQLWPATYYSSAISLKLSVINSSNSVYKMYISEFWFRWPKVRSICYLSMKCQWEKIERSLFGTKAILNTLSLKRQVTGRIDTLNRKIATSAPSSWP